MTESTSPSSAANGQRLSPREIDVLTLMARGLSNREIAAQLFLSQHTVLGYVKSVFAKLAVHTRVQAVVRGLEIGVITLPDATGGAPWP
jgi:DNA-binding CsgD family transcriptional regulator